MVLWGPFLSLDRETRGKVLHILVRRHRRRLRRRLGQRGEEYNFHPKLDYFLLFLLSSAYLRGFVFS